MSFFDWLASHPESEEARLFSEVMVSLNGAEPPSAAAAYAARAYGRITEHTGLGTSGQKMPSNGQLPWKNGRIILGRREFCGAQQH
jgi:hypothetical protein